MTYKTSDIANELLTYYLQESWTAEYFKRLLAKEVVAAARWRRRLVVN